ncbi:hypothetical protein C8R45DRAFT_1046268 [Mycena sanguinolenta]|nr:hypothetical protein C8R45DRAFT_1046268 [Mycena sanguinolenta]
MTTTIPQELIETILSHFDPVDDRDSLKSAALAAAEFAVPAQAILFRRLYLHCSLVTVDWGLTFERALNIFNASPHLSSHMEDLTLVFPPKDSPAYHAQLEDLLQRCIRVRRLVLKGTHMPAIWNNFTPTLQSAMAAFFKCAVSLEKLHILDIKAVQQSLVELAAQRCSVLSIRGAWISTDDVSLSAERAIRARPRLDYLILSTRTGLLRPGAYLELMAPAYTSSLRRLAIDQTRLTNEYLRAVQSTLTDLSLTCAHPNIYLDTYTSFNLLPLPRLTTLELKLLSVRTLVLPGLPSILAQFADVLPVLHTLILRIILRSCTEDLGPATETLLAACDVSLAMSGSLSRCIWDIVFQRQLPAREHPETYRTLLEYNLPRMREAHALEVRYSTRREYENSLP